ncbi:MAG: 3-deoxy-manno-octulosonate cytidylyltransferase [marine bacterium B5-7]|nr:MAG: 3-deoxy-manno-octulosonate cytidylyltransferase [marine bacterium B5-7]
MLQHVYETATQTQAKNITIATDDRRIADCAKSFGASVIMTSNGHESGTDRIAEAVKQLEIDDNEVVVNLQGDEFGLPVSLINQVATSLNDNPDKQVATLCELINSQDEFIDQNVVKVLFDKHNTAIYFSRSPIPLNRAGGLPEKAYKHIGLYAYRSAYLQEFTQLAPCAIEQAEALEQLRVLYNGGKIHVDIAVDKTGIGVDSADDLELARSKK